MQFVRRGGVCVVGALFLCLQVYGGKLYEDGVIACVAESVITAHDVALEAPYGGNAVQRAVALVERELIWAEFQRLGIDVPMEPVQSRLDRLVSERAGGDRAKFEEMLDKEGLRIDEFEGRIEKLVVVEIMMREHVSRHADTSPEDVLEFYRAHPDRFVRQPRFRMQRIMLAKDKKGRSLEQVRQLEKTIRTELDKGASFGELAKKYSDGANRENGGITDWLKPADFAMLEKMLAKLSPGEVASEPLDRPGAIYFIKLADREDGGARSLDGALKKEIKRFLDARDEVGRRQEYLHEVAKRHFVKIHEPAVRTAFERDAAAVLQEFDAALDRARESAKAGTSPR